MPYFNHVRTNPTIVMYYYFVIIPLVPILKVPIDLTTCYNVCINHPEGKISFVSLC